MIHDAFFALIPLSFPPTPPTPPQHPIEEYGVLESRNQSNPTSASHPLLTWGTTAYCTEYLTGRAIRDRGDGVVVLWCCGAVVLWCCGVVASISFHADEVALTYS